MCCVEAPGEGEMAIRCIAVSIVASILPLWAQLSATGQKAPNDYSLEKEAALGKQLAAEIGQRTTLIENTVVQAYVNRLAQKLAANMPNGHAHFTFSVIAEDPCPAVHEPDALPGGYVFVPSALFLAAQDEAEFAGMLAHAMAHIAVRQATQQATRGQEANYASGPLIFVGGWGVSCTEGPVPLGFVAARRNYEREADILAIEALARAGINPNALVRYTERVQPAPSSILSGKWSAHLPRDERIGIMTSAISKLPATQYAAPADEDFVAARAEVSRLVEPHRPTPPSLWHKRP
jgi:beta-barrel assembly-enhancing protease